MRAKTLIINPVSSTAAIRSVCTGNALQPHRNEGLDKNKLFEVEQSSSVEQIRSLTRLFISWLDKSSLANLSSMIYKKFLNNLID